MLQNKIFVVLSLMLFTAPSEGFPRLEAPVNQFPSAESSRSPSVFFGNLAQAQPENQNYGFSGGQVQYSPSQPLPYSPNSFQPSYGQNGAPGDGYSNYGSQNPEPQYVIPDEPTYSPGFQPNYGQNGAPGNEVNDYGSQDPGLQYGIPAQTTYPSGFQQGLTNAPGAEIIQPPLGVPGVPETLQKSIPQGDGAPAWQMSNFAPGFTPPPSPPISPPISLPVYPPPSPPASPPIYPPISPPVLPPASPPIYPPISPPVLPPASPPPSFPSIQSGGYPNPPEVTGYPTGYDGQPDSTFSDEFPVPVTVAQPPLFPPSISLPDTPVDSILFPAEEGPSASEFPGTPLDQTNPAGNSIPPSLFDRGDGRPTVIDNPVSSLSDLGTEPEGDDSGDNDDDFGSGYDTYDFEGEFKDENDDGFDNWNNNDVTRGFGNVESGDHDDDETEGYGGIDTGDFGGIDTGDFDAVDNGDDGETDYSFTDFVDFEDYEIDYSGTDFWYFDDETDHSGTDFGDFYNVEIEDDDDTDMGDFSGIDFGDFGDIDFGDDDDDDDVELYNSSSWEGNGDESNDDFIDQSQPSVPPYFPIQSSGDRFRGGNIPWAIANQKGLRRNCCCNYRRKDSSDSPGYHGYANFAKYYIYDPRDLDSQSRCCCCRCCRSNTFGKFYY